MSKYLEKNASYVIHVPFGNFSELLMSFTS
jgi:uncharacterized protein YozE (UPF0346 family)